MIDEVATGAEETRRWWPALRAELSTRGALLRIGPPALAMLAANIVFWIAAHAHHFDYLHTKNWVHYDALLYEDIAAHGYVFGSCATIAPKYGVHNWCGNAGWFPGYPWLIWIGKHLGLSASQAGVAISSVFELGLLLVLWNCFLLDRRPARALLALAIAAFFFGNVYQRAVFPISMEIFFLLLTFWMATRRQWLWAGALGALAAFTYATGFLIMASLGLWILIEPSIRPWRTKVLAIAASCGLPLAGYLAVFVVQRIQTGVWNAFFKVQAKYHYTGLHFPLTKFRTTIRPLLRLGLHDRQIPALQTLLVALFCIAVLSWCAINARSLEAIDRLALCATLCFWIFPLALGGDVHLYRSESLLLPAVLIVRRFKQLSQAYLLAVLVPLSYLMSGLFFRSILV